MLLCLSMHRAQGKHCKHRRQPNASIFHCSVCVCVCDQGSCQLGGGGKAGTWQVPGLLIATARCKKQHEDKDRSNAFNELTCGLIARPAVRCTCTLEGGSESPVSFQCSDSPPFCWYWMTIHQVSSQGAMEMTLTILATLILDCPQQTQCILLRLAARLRCITPSSFHQRLQAGCFALQRSVLSRKSWDNSEPLSQLFSS